MSASRSASLLVVVIAFAGCTQYEDLTLAASFEQPGLFDSLDADPSYPFPPAQLGPVAAADLWNATALRYETIAYSLPDTLSVRVWWDPEGVALRWARTGPATTLLPSVLERVFPTATPADRAAWIATDMEGQMIRPNATPDAEGLSAWAQEEGDVEAGPTSATLRRAEWTLSTSIPVRTLREEGVCILEVDAFDRAHFRAETTLQEGQDSAEDPEKQLRDTAARCLARHGITAADASTLPLKRKAWSSS